MSGFSWQNMAIIIQQDATEYGLFKCQLLYMFRVVFHPSSGARNAVSTVSGINETCTATCRERGWSGTLHILLYQIAAFVLCSYLLMFLN